MEAEAGRHPLKLKTNQQRPLLQQKRAPHLHPATGAGPFRKIGLDLVYLYLRTIAQGQHGLRAYLLHRLPSQILQS